MKSLTRKYLEEQGIDVIQLDDNNYEVYRTGLLNQNGGSKRRKLKIRTISKSHKFGTEKNYIGVAWNKHCYTLSRLLYAWFVGDIPEGYEVDHIDDDPFNNRLDNLQILTRKENLRKRPHNGCNQYTPNANPDSDYWKYHREIKEKITSLEEEKKWLKKNCNQADPDYEERWHEINREIRELKKRMSCL